MLLLATPVVRLVCPLHVLSFLGCGMAERVGAAWRRGWGRHGGEGGGGMPERVGAACRRGWGRHAGEGGIRTHGPLARSRDSRETAPGAAVWRRGWDSNPRTARTVNGSRETAPGAAVWRRGWDSNPRTARTVNGFRDRPIRPLWHLSSFLGHSARFIFSCPRMAERVGFEPTVELPLHMLSRHAPSTTRSPLPSIEKPARP